MGLVVKEEAGFRALRVVVVAGRPLVVKVIDQPVSEPVAKGVAWLAANKCQTPFMLLTV